MRLCLKLRQGAKAPETPGPLSLVLDYGEAKGVVKGSQAAQKTRALDDPLRFPKKNLAMVRERGPNAEGPDPASRWSAPTIPA